MAGEVISDLLLAQRPLSPTAGAFVLAAVLLLPSSAPTGAQQALPTLTRVEQVRKLTPEEAQRGHPVKLTGVITLADPARSEWFLQDPTGGIYFSPQDRSAVWRPGQQVEVSGLSTQGVHLPFIIQASLRELGTGPLPPAKKASFGDLATDDHDCNWVEVYGVVRRAEVVNGRLVLALAAEGKRVQAIVSEGTLPWEDYSRLVDAEVRVQAVCGVVDRSPQAVFLLKLKVPSVEHLAVEVNAPGQPYALSLQPIARVPSLAVSTGLVHRIRVKGALTTNPAGTWLLKDESGSVAFQSQQSFQGHSNQLIEALGFPGSGAAGRPVLEEVTGRELVLGSPYVKPGATNAPKAPPNYLPVLNRIEQIRRLGPEEAGRGYPIRVRGVVTFCDGEWYCLFVQDETAGIYVDLHGQSFQQAPGTVLQIEGFSGPGDFAPVILQPRLQVLGQAPRPISRHATLGFLRTGREDGQPVAVEGIVRSMRIETGHLYLEVGSGSGHFQCLLPGFWQKSAPTNLVDALVQVNGVCGTLFNQQRQLVGIQLFIQDLADIAVLKPASEDPYATPIRPINTLLRYSPEGASGHRAHIQGTVTLQRRGEYFFIQDETGGLQVHSAQTNELRPGDQVAVLGFPENNGFTPDLHDAVFRKLGAGTVPSAIQVTPEQALGTNFNGDLYDGRLVQMEARVLEYLPRLTAPTLVLEAHGRTFYAVAMESGQLGWMRALRRDDQVRVTGVCSVQVAPDGVPQSFQLLLGKFSDLVVLARAPWLTFQRMLLALGG